MNRFSNIKVDLRGAWSEEHDNLAQLCWSNSWKGSVSDIYYVMDQRINKYNRQIAVALQV